MADPEPAIDQRLAGPSAVGCGRTTRQRRPLRAAPQSRAPCPARRSRARDPSMAHIGAQMAKPDIRRVALGNTALVHERGPTATASIRRAACWAWIAALSLSLIILAAGFGPDVADQWWWIILFGPAAGVVVAGLLFPAPRPPSSVLLTRAQSGVVWRWFVRPYLPAFLTPFACAAAEYAGAWLSTVRGSNDTGLHPLIFGDQVELGWSFPLAGCLIGGLVGWAGILAFVIPLKSAAAVPRLWKSDRPESLRIMGYLSFAAGMGLTAWALIAAFPDDDPDRLELLRHGADLILGTIPPGAPDWSTWVARAGATFLAAGGVLTWVMRPAGSLQQ